MESYSDFIVQISDVSKYFGNRNNIVTALENVSINIRRLENVALVGETGSGKTTLGRISCGLEKPNKGTVILDDKKMESYKRKELWKKSQYIHQDPYGAIDNLETVRSILGRPLTYLLNIRDSGEIEERSKSALLSSGLDDTYLDKKGGDLSGGEKQRVLIARAFIMEPKYVVIDEPTTMIDFVHRDEIIATLSQMGETRRTTLMLITHDITIVPKLVKKVAVLYRGRIVEYGDVVTMQKDPLHPYTTFLGSITVEKLINSKSLLEYLENYGKNRQGMKNTGKGCVYSSVCPIAISRCFTEEPKLTEDKGGHLVACFKPGEFKIV
ncbi:oligopeptide/dipeptide ABC transporter ATP-binding protein [Cuniculiplasma sp. SKW3]|uniref:oligopeptide/dipeptide ABC transporter ATP-binding protein n=1 Tax=unclassified Cuniculiplasma TaxID=2619706 RepID=UPI003FD463B9